MQVFVIPKCHTCGSALEILPREFREKIEGYEKVFLFFKDKGGRVYFCRKCGHNFIVYKEDFLKTVTYE